MKVSCESVLKELVGAMTVKCHVTYSPLALHVEMIQEGPVFSFRSSFLRGSLNLNRLPIANGHLEKAHRTHQMVNLNKTARMQYANLST